MPGPCHEHLQDLAGRVWDERTILDLIAATKTSLSTGWQWESTARRRRFSEAKSKGNEATKTALSRFEPRLGANEACLAARLSRPIGPGSLVKATALPWRMTDMTDS